MSKKIIYHAFMYFKILFLLEFKVIIFMNKNNYHIFI